MSLLGQGTQFNHGTHGTGKDVEVSYDYKRESQPKIGQSDATVDVKDDSDDVINDALTYVPPVDSMFEVTLPASESSHADYIHEHEADVLSVVD